MPQSFFYMACEFTCLFACRNPMHYLINRSIPRAVFYQSFAPFQMLSVLKDGLYLITCTMPSKKYTEYGW